jgi:hypothetical protein
MVGRSRSSGSSGGSGEEFRPRFGCAHAILRIACPFTSSIRRRCGQRNRFSRVPRVTRRPQPRRHGFVPGRIRNHRPATERCEDETDNFGVLVDHRRPGIPVGDVIGGDEIERPRQIEGSVRRDLAVRYPKRFGGVSRWKAPPMVVIGPMSRPSCR